jgi:hypothetical protein
LEKSGLLILTLGLGIVNAWAGIAAGCVCGVIFFEEARHRDLFSENLS